MGVAVTDYPSMGNHHPHSTPLASGMDSKDIKMLEEQTHLNQEEILEQYAKFKGATSGEDVMSRSVFSKIMKTCYPRTYKPELEEDIFRIYDVDNSGTIEFKIADCLMTEMDTDQDGVVSEEELVTAFMRSEKLTTTLVNKIMTRFTSASVKILSD